MCMGRLRSRRQRVTALGRESPCDPGIKRQIFTTRLGPKHGLRFEAIDAPGIALRCGGDGLRLSPVRLETGADVHGNPVRVENAIKRPVGRPKARATVISARRARGTVSSRP